jgi:serine/threonine protein phosphatase PrpC
MLERRMIQNSNENKFIEVFEHMDRPVYISQIENNNVIYGHVGRKSYNTRNKILSPPESSHRHVPMKTYRIRSPQETLRFISYSSSAYNNYPLKTNHSIYEKNNEYPNNRNRNESTLRKRETLNDKSIRNNLSMKNIEKPLERPYFYSKYQSAKNNKRTTKMTISLDNHRRDIDDDFANERRNHKTIESKHQKKPSNIPKTSIYERENSQDKLKKRLFTTSVDSIKKYSNSNLYNEHNNYNYNYNRNNNIYVKNNNNNNNNIYVKNNNNNNIYVKDNNNNNYNNHNFYNSKNLVKKNSINYNINYSNTSTYISGSNHNLNKKTSTIIEKGISRQKDKDKENERRHFYSKKYSHEIKKEEPAIKEEVDKQLLLKMQNLFKTLSNLSSLDNPFDCFGEKKEPIQLSPEIFSCHHSKFRPSICSSDTEFKKTDFIKAYAYNTSEGNIRDYNEDTITARKVIDSRDRDKSFYIFAVYDGHGGNGCSLYLKNNLYNNITDCSMSGLRNAINITEKNFLENEALNIYGDLGDTSGSCGIIVLIQDKKCIIGNVGDSRCVLFKNKRLFYSTTDHKPNSYIEKRRIELAGGSIYKSKSVIPLYQNGKQIEIPWRVNPGRLSVSRTFGDVEAKLEKFGGQKGVVVSTPDIVEYELNDQYNFIVIGCDGIFDVLSNMEILECIQIVLKLNRNKRKKINELCGDFAAMIIKSALAKESFDNISCIVVVFNIDTLI